MTIFETTIPDTLAWDATSAILAALRGLDTPIEVDVTVTACLHNHVWRVRMEAAAAEGE